MLFFIALSSFKSADKCTYSLFWVIVKIVKNLPEVTINILDDKAINLHTEAASSWMFFNFMQYHRGLQNILSQMSKIHKLGTINLISFSR